VIGSDGLVSEGPDSKPDCRSFGRAAQVFGMYHYFVARAMLDWRFDLFFFGLLFTGEAM
jgi:hypothetical protein